MYLDIVHTTETVSYMVIERGIHELSDGTWVEAGHAKNIGKKWKRIKFTHKFDSKPVVLT
jgi:serralysin